MGYLAHSITRKKGQTLFAFIVRESDSAVFNYSTTSFQEGQQLHLTTNPSDRVPFRVPYIEIREGRYRLEVDSTNFQDGSYSIQSRALVGVTESLPLENVILEVEAGEGKPGLLNIEAIMTPGLTLFAYIRDTFTSKYLFSDFQSFRIFNPLDDPEEVRGNFRHSFLEEEPGKYVLNRSLATIEDTTLELGVYYLAGGLEYKAGSPITIHIHDGRQQRGVLFNTVLINQNTISLDNLRYITSSGEPVSGASIYVFRKSEYSAGSLDNALGKTFSKADGRWNAPIPVQAGETYVVLFFKDSEYGPDTTEVVV